MGKAEKTREFILEKTAPIFNTKGYAGTSLSDMTEATGLTKGSIYGNFANKDEVAACAFEHNLAKVTAIIKQEQAKYTKARDMLLVYVNVYEHFLKYPFPVGGCPILNTAIEADDTNEPLKQKACDAIINWKAAIIKLLKAGIDGKEFKSNLDVEKVALTLIAMIEGAIMIAKVTGKINYRRLIMESAADIVNSL